MIKMADIAHMYKLSLRNGHPETSKVLRGLLMLGLGNKQRECLQMMTANGPMRCIEVANAMNIGRRNAGMILYKLTDYGLIDHEPIRNSKGVHFVWKDIPERHNK